MLKMVSRPPPQKKNAVDLMRIYNKTIEDDIGARCKKNTPAYENSDNYAINVRLMLNKKIAVFYPKTGFCTSIVCQCFTAQFKAALA